MRKKPKADLVRLGLEPESGRVLTDAKGTMKGRGGYACRECLPDLRLNKRIQRAFRNRAKQICVAQGLAIKEKESNP
jgi:predicted RNA-binding protein YlxR (DUF448 family)